MQNIHASCISYKKKGVLFLGKSGSGKSDICLRMICNHNAKLIADDRVNISLNKNKVYANYVENLAGLLEVRGVGILNFPYYKKTQINIDVELVDSFDKVERLPQEDFFEFEGAKIKRIKLYPFENSAENKRILALK